MGSNEDKYSAGNEPVKNKEDYYYQGCEPKQVRDYDETMSAFDLPEMQPETQKYLDSLEKGEHIDSSIDKDKDYPFYDIPTIEDNTEEFKIVDSDLMMTSKYNEDYYLRKVIDYLKKQVYNEHYHTGSNITAFDLIVSDGNGVPFSLGNITKYASRAGKKDAFEKEVMKIIHYALMALYAYDNDRELDNYDEVNG